MNGIETGTMLEILPLICAMLAALTVIAFLRSHTDKAVLSACREISGFVSKKSKDSGWYVRTEQMLKRTGAEFRFKNKATPEGYLALRIIFAFAGFCAGNIISSTAGAVAVLPAWMLPAMFLNYLNKSDNEKMLTDIKLVYNSLAIQIRAGISMSDALLECYGCARQKRFRKALMDLSSDIVMKSDIFDALESFQSKFDNRYIDSLCITVLQALESGQAVELLADISEQIKDMEASVLERRKGKLDRSVTFYQLGILGAILAVILYACVRYMLSAATNF